MLGTLAEVAAYIVEHGVREVYITLPLGSQPRIVELLEQLQGTTASLFFVPDVFGISIIQGRLQDMNGVPVVGICETPFTGTNELVKRISDVVLATLILVLISPLMLVIAIGVKLSSPGPVMAGHVTGDTLTPLRALVGAGRGPRRAASARRRRTALALRRARARPGPGRAAEHRGPVVAAARPP